VLVPGGGDDLRAGDEGVRARPTRRRSRRSRRRSGGKRQHAQRRRLRRLGHRRCRSCQLLQREHATCASSSRIAGCAERLSEALKGVVVLARRRRPTSICCRRSTSATRDAFLGISDEDERNLMSCQLAQSSACSARSRSCRSPTTCRSTSRLGIDVGRVAALLCANRILAFVRSRSISTVATIAEGKAESLEIELQRGSRLVGKTLERRRLPARLRRRGA
jgi:hypothetical protein